MSKFSFKDFTKISLNTKDIFPVVETLYQNWISNKYNDHYIILNPTNFKLDSVCNVTSYLRCNNLNLDDFADMVLLYLPVFKFPSYQGLHKIQDSLMIFDKDIFYKEYYDKNKQVTTMLDNFTECCFTDDKIIAVDSIIFGYISNSIQRACYLVSKNIEKGTQVEKARIWNICFSKLGK